MLTRRVPILFLLACSAPFAFTQTPAQPPSDQQAAPLKQREPIAPAAGMYTVEPGTRILLNMINSVSTKQAQIGDRMYLETAFPILANGRIVIPQGSWVTGTITAIKRPGKVKGRGELQVKFDSLTLANGTTRVFKSDLGSVDARQNETLKREESTVKGPGDKKTDVGTVVGSTTSGTVIGSGVGALSGNVGRGAGIGALGGAAAGLLGVLLTRGPDAMLPKGSTMEMVLDRPLTFNDSELNFANAPPSRTLSEGTPPQTTQNGGFKRSPF